jgi:fermentation-respiration switch protein FrsA (DUF1100 family)
MNNNLNQLEQQAVEWVNLVVEKQFEPAVKFFDKTMSEQVPPARLQEIWNGLISQVGNYENVIGTRTSQMNEFTLVFVTCKFAKATLDIQLTYNDERKIAGLFFQPSSAVTSYSLPEYADADLFTETEVSIGTGKWLLPATLTVPKGEGPFPAIILVHGSGPNDRDETLGGNKPFKDLAWGLASRNIAVLRYEKRTKQYPQETVANIQFLTVQEETIDDALAAVTLLAETKGIDNQRIYVLGHSLGGMLAPRIASQDGRIAGIIILAGLTRKLTDTILDQFHYLASLDGTIDEKKAEQINAIAQQVKKVNDLDFNEGEIIFGAGKAYWQDLEKYDTVTTAKSLTIPMLILQGERDYQVTMEDFYGWASGLKGMKNVTLKTYATLNHLFITGTGKSTPSEYNQPGHVNKTIIEDIAAWIKSQH